MAKSLEGEPLKMRDVRSASVGLSDCEGCSPRQAQAATEDAEDLPLSILLASGIPTPTTLQQLRISAATIRSDSSEAVEVSNQQEVKSPRPKRARISPTASPQGRRRCPGSPAPSEASRVVCQKAEICPAGVGSQAAPSTPARSAQSSEAPSPPSRRKRTDKSAVSPAPKAQPSPKATAKAQNKRKTLAQRLQDRQKQARTAKKEEVNAAKAASKAVAYQAKVQETEQRIADAIRSDRKLYEKLLCFEVMEIEEVAKQLRAADKGLSSVGRKRIREFLEAQGFVLTQQKKLSREVYEKNRSWYRGGRRN